VLPVRFIVSAKGIKAFLHVVPGDSQMNGKYPLNMGQNLLTGFMKKWDSFYLEFTVVTFSRQRYSHSLCRHE